MRQQVRSGLEAGARTLSLGLVYMPGAFSETEELIELAKVAARFGAPLVPHVRNEADGVIEAVGEMIEVARRSGAPLHLSHLKVVGRPSLVEPLLGHLGSISLAQGDYEEAMRYLEEGLALSNEIGNKLSVSTTLYNMALAAQGQGDHERAAELYTEGIKSSAEVDDKANIAYCLDGLAQVAAAQGEVERAARLFGAAEASLEAAGGALYDFVQDRSVHDQVVEAVRSRLDEVTFSAAWAEGGAMSVSEVVEYAISGEEVAAPSSPTPKQPLDGGREAVLTRREMEIAALIAQGLTNRQIATELSISEHTAANHIAKTLKKLGLRSRSQLTAGVIEQRALE